MTTHNPKGSGRDSVGNAAEWLNLEDVVKRYVRIKGTNHIGLCWGGRPAQELDTPDTLYVRVKNEDLRIPASIVRIWDTPTMDAVKNNIQFDLPDDPAAAS